MANDTWDDVFDGPAISVRQKESSRRRRARKKSEVRRDIQGLRAVAVVAVVVNHLTDHPVGGFVGVDVFFVISGFLITGLLLREGDRTGKISWIGFYKRRIRRLIPASTTVTVFTLVGAYFLFSTNRFHDTFTDGVWATLFGMNWRLIDTGTDYFTADRAISPLQHYWSLSVEEQYYIVWPIILILAFVLCRRLFADRGNATRVTGSIAAGLLTVGSLAVAVTYSSGNGIVAYFNTFTRAWELGLGAIVAVTARYVHFGRIVLTVASWVGLAMIGVSLFVITPAHFPFPGAILPCVGAALVVGAHSDRARAANGVLTNRVAQYLGDTSYSIYLVHFPVIIFAATIFADRSVLYYVIVAAVILALSVLLYEMIEDPIRKSGWLRAGRRDPDEDKPNRFPRIVLAMTLGVATGAIAFIAAPADDNAKLNEITQAINEPQASLSSGAAIVPTGPQQAALTEKLTAALKSTSWPSFVVTLGERVKGEGDKACEVRATGVPQCEFGDKNADRVMYLVGDSTSIAYDDAFINMINKMPGWKLRLVGSTGCPFADVTLNEADGNSFAGDCDARNQGIVDEINRVKPDIVVETSSRADDQYVPHIVNELKKIQASAGELVIVPAPPKGANPDDCYSQVSSPLDCVTPLDSDYASWKAGNQAIAKDVGGTYIDPTGWTSVGGQQPIFVDNIPMRWNGVHITAQYAGDVLAPVVHEALVAAKVIPAAT